jgi:hypothetical protein
LKELSEYIKKRKEKLLGWHKRKEEHKEKRQNLPKRCNYETI